MTADAVAALLDVEGVLQGASPLQHGSGASQDVAELPPGSAPRLRVVRS